MTHPERVTGSASGGSHPCVQGQRKADVVKGRVTVSQEESITRGHQAAQWWA